MVLTHNFMDATVNANNVLANVSVSVKMNNLSSSN